MVKLAALLCVLKTRKDFEYPNTYYVYLTESADIMITKDDFPIGGTLAGRFHEWVKEQEASRLEEIYTDPHLEFIPCSLKTFKEFENAIHLSRLVKGESDECEMS